MRVKVGVRVRTSVSARVRVWVRVRVRNRTRVRVRVRDGVNGGQRALALDELAQYLAPISRRSLGGHTPSSLDAKAFRLITGTGGGGRTHTSSGLRGTPPFLSLSTALTHPTPWFLSSGRHSGQTKLKGQSRPISAKDF